MSRTLHQDDAVDHVAAMLERPLTTLEERIVRLEGYAPEPYRDSKGVPTVGVGQTGEWMERSFPDSLAHHVDITRGFIPEFDNLSPELQVELVQATYRGDLGLSGDTRTLINTGDFQGAAKEFLNNDEYKNEGTEQQIQDRMYALHKALRREGEYGQHHSALQMLDQYEAQTGDNPYSIAKSRGLTLEELASLNPEVGESLLRGGLNVGQKLNVAYAPVL